MLETICSKHPKFPGARVLEDFEGRSFWEAFRIKAAGRWREDNNLFQNHIERLTNAKLFKPRNGPSFVRVELAEPFAFPQDYEFWTIHLTLSFLPRYVRPSWGRLPILNRLSRYTFSPEMGIAVDAKMFNRLEAGKLYSLRRRTWECRSIVQHDSLPPLQGGAIKV